ncbi:MAG: hypothetical protein JST30_02520 [Armatimonadetes bacterium]|nr:hypothetical protein [Armatimonadota bacterium]
MRTLSLLSSCAALVAGAVVIGCSPSIAASETQGGAKPLVNPKEKLEEQRMEQATAGLDLSGPTVKVVAKGVTPDKARAAKLRALADAELSSRNVWFLAVGAYRDAVLADPADPRPYVGLAKAFLIESETVPAEKALRTAVTLDPKAKEARFMLGTLRQGAADYEGALAEWRTLAGIDPDYPQVLARLAVASYYTEDYRSAWGYVDQAEARKQPVPPQFKSLLKEAAPRP